tara:strand:+ start:1013 stop:2011 length:999 start_codon:yes stop_codon:yes gene_type:complete
MQVIINILYNFWNLSIEMAPFLLLGFLLAGLLSLFISKELIKKHLSNKSKYAVIKSVILGIPLPVCSCGVIPLAASIREKGASKGSTASFVTSTPQTGIDSIIITYDMIGMTFALIRVSVAFISGIITGLIVDFFKNKKNDYYFSENDFHDFKRRKIKDGLKYAFYNLPKSLFKPLIIGILFASLISTFIKDDYFISYNSTFTEIIFISLISIPMYICSTASVPLALSFINLGISPGAVLIFLIIGPATNTLTLTTLWKIIGKKETILFIGSIIVNAVIFGILLNNLKVEGIVSNCLNYCDGTHKAIDIICVVLLYIILLFPFLKKIKQTEQ